MKRDAIKFINDIFEKAGTADVYRKTGDGIRMLLDNHDKRKYKWSDPISDIPGPLEDMETNSCRVVVFSLTNSPEINEKIEAIIDIK